MQFHHSIDMNELRNCAQVCAKAKEDGKNFQCLQCYESFRFRRHYDKHIQGHKQNNCKYCGKLYTVRKQLAIHLHQEHQIKLQDLKYSCQFCDRRFVKKLSLYQHYQLHAEGKKVCLHCGMFFGDIHEFLKHQERHKYEKPWKCEKCEEKFSRRQQYQMHMQAHGKYKCLTCMESFSAQSKLVEHKKKGHEIKELEAKHICERCKRSFHLHRALVLHQRVHQGDKSFDCTDCNKNFNTKKSYSKHLNTASHRGSKDKVKSKQTKDNIFVCDICGKIFKEKLALGLHVTRIHNKEEPTKCNYCDYKSTCKANLKRHMEFHTEDRKFICECCGASFHMLCTLKEHYLYVHSEERNFPCPKCDKTFKRKCGLNRHMQDHSENRPHVCHCGQSYKRMSHLKRHKESSHGLVSQPSKLCRLRRNDSGMLVPLVEKSTPISTKETTVTLSSKCHDETENENIANEEELRFTQVLSFQETKVVSPEIKHLKSIITTFSPNSQMGLNMGCLSANEEMTNEETVNEETTNIEQLESSQVFNFQEAKEVSSKVEIAESTITTVPPNSHESLNMGSLPEGILNCQQSSFQSLGVFLSNQIIPCTQYPQVVNLIQEPTESLPIIDLVQLVAPANTLPEETTVLLCLSSFPATILAESCQFSTL